MGQGKSISYKKLDSSVRYVDGKIEDITKRKHADDLLRKTNQQLEERALDRT